MATLALRPVDEKDTSALRAIYAPLYRYAHYI